MTTVVTIEAGFETTSYCERLCLRGLGGNLCQCNAVHFAGKRAHTVEINRAFDIGDNNGNLLQLLLQRRLRDHLSKYPLGYLSARPNHDMPPDVPVRKLIVVDGGRCSQDQSGDQGLQSTTSLKSDGNAWQRNPGSIADAKTAVVDGGIDEDTNVGRPTLALASDGSWHWETADDKTERKRR